jgi:hypothetical protein
VKLLRSPTATKARHAAARSTSLNDAVPGDVRDTSLPRDLGLDLQKLVLGAVLTPSRRDLLKGWLRGNTRSGHRGGPNYLAVVR